jgi:plastocyanin
MNNRYDSLRKWFTAVLFFVLTSLFAYDKIYANHTENIIESNSETQDVTIKDHAFNPQTLTIPVNTTVTWTNADEMVHTVTSETGLFESGSINPGGTFSYQFKTTGVYKYHCK